MGVSIPYAISTRRKDELHLASKDVKGAEHLCFPKDYYHWIDVTGSGKQPLDSFVGKLKCKSWKQVAEIKQLK